MSIHDPAQGGAATRERVLQEAAALFIQHGFKRTPLSKISSRLGITKAALYYYFQSKDELLIALVSPLLDRVDELLASASSMPRDHEGRRELLRRYAAILSSDRRAAAILSHDINVSTHPAIAPRIRGHVRSLIDLLSGPDADPKEVVRVTVALSVLQRGLIGRPGDPDITHLLSRDEHQRILLHIAFSILEMPLEPEDIDATVPSAVDGDPSLNGAKDSGRVRTGSPE